MAPSHYPNWCWHSIKGSLCTNLRPISQEVLKIPIRKTGLKNTLVKLPSHLPEANDLICLEDISGICLNEALKCLSAGRSDLQFWIMSSDQWKKIAFVITYHWKLWLQLVIHVLLLQKQGWPQCIAGYFVITYTLETLPECCEGQICRDHFVYAPSQ